MFGNLKKKGTVFVGLSGGVDSAVSAALLKKEGYDIVGVFIKVWQPDFLPCTWKEDRLEAMRVAAFLEIPFVTIDLEKEYKQDVVDYMVREYKNGRTPNPDVMCNKYVKFGAFFKKAMDAGADYIATGHYAQRIVNKKNTSVEMHKGKDVGKDQTYFLWTLTQNELQRTLFPVGGYEKKEVRELAQTFGLPNSERKDSQGLCFVGRLDMKDFLKHFIEEKKGNVLDEDGNIIGWHEGVFFYTLGQRHGFTIAKKGVEDVPSYVLSKDIENNTITVGKKEADKHLSSEKKDVLLENCNWISENPTFGKTYTAKVRYRQGDQTCVLEEGGDLSHIRAVFSEPQIISPGQSIVFYDGDECLGGGIIVH